jgi:SNF2 family DNA or RNA helicase
MKDADTKLRVRRAGSWLFVEGEVELSEVKLTLGELLEAARLAKRFVRAGEATYVEINEEMRKKLAPLAAAVDLATAPGEDARVSEAFGAVLADVAPFFASQSGVDLAAYASRAQRSASARAQHLEDAQYATDAHLEHGALREYQEEGVAFLLDAATWSSGAVLADDMGLGKTVQTAAVLRARAKNGPALIVAPASVVSNWGRELARFVPSLRVRSWNDDKSAHEALGPGDVMLASYGLVQRRIDALSGAGATRFATAVLDEAHFVKNSDARRSHAVRSLERDFTIALTGTPLENHLGELKSLMDVVLPGVFGSDASFRERFRRPIEAGGDDQKLQALSRLLAPFMLRRTRAEVLRELPPREEIVEIVDPSEEERKKYVALRDACAMAFAQNKREKKETSAQLRIALLAALTRLRQLSCDVGLVDSAWKEGSTKTTRIVDIVKQIVDEGAHVLVFSQFKTFVERIQTALEEAGVKPALLTGDTPTAARPSIIDAFQRGDHGALCVSLMAGGTGLNLTRATYVIHADPWWNPAVEEQATSRAHRMGQEEPVTVYRLITRGSIEEAVLSMHAEKRKLAEGVLAGKSARSTLPTEDLLALLSG